uniref:Uncharacterized protein n=1 Tax=Candidatus Kentrum sp. UNK TaxID=2126344 RepID=A0A451AGJ3_9GAMM|nr:MAG: hypothetical protein BECKUNK1418G_GA0071005_105718 [Candidatus Kentron sp. UNK]VFK71305.1 MAG: hypothetical protein BECKUNK1418H_GA0071006_105918 [Candidatus Kentron sp. UNK]
MLITLPSFMLEHFSLYPKKTIQTTIVRRASASDNYCCCGVSSLLRGIRQDPFDP